MMQLNHILWKCTAGYQLSKSQEKVNHLMYMDGIWLFTKSERKLETLITDSENTLSRYRNSIWHRKMQVMKIGKRHMTERIKLSIKEKSERSEKRKLTNTWNIGSWHNQTSGNEKRKT